MAPLLLLIGELFFLSLLSRRLVQSMYRIVYALTRSRSAGIWVITIILFPGTVIHELAHLFVAEILRVGTGKLTLVPPPFAEASGGKESEINVGSVAIAQTDPFRRTLIGVAPVYVGIAVLAALSYFIRHPLAVLQGDALQNALVSGVFYYLLFAISNSMFSSKEDMKGVLPFALTVGIFVAAGYVAGFRIGLTAELIARITAVAQTLVRSLGMVLGVNLIILAATAGLLAILTKKR